jgi:hypothetical protein
MGKRGRTPQIRASDGTPADRPYVTRNAKGAFMFELRSTLAAGTALVLLAACADQNVVAPHQIATGGVDRSLTSNSPIWRDQATGTTADGAQYALLVPNDWNGDIVFYAHGIVPPLAPVSLPAATDWDNAVTLRDALGQAGFAVAYSSFGENGYA